MSTTVFTDGVSLTSASWFCDVDKAAYPVFSGVTGTNSVSATASANFAHSSTNPLMILVPAFTNTSTVALTITPSGGAALAAKNVFSGGAALSGGEFQQGVPAVVAYNGTQYELLTGQPRFKVGSLTRDLAGASGSVAYTGIGFKPRAIILAGAESAGGATAGIGFSTVVDEGSIYNNQASSADTWVGGSVNAINFTTGVGASQVADVSSFDSDGFTLAWTKIGAAAGNGTVNYLAIR